MSGKSFTVKMAQRHTYTRDELEQYFDRICMPKEKRVFDVANLPDHQRLAFLHLLQKHHLVKVPWENLTQHYSWHRVINVKPKHLFRKIVNQPGRGGYCMEANYFFHLVLFSLGFDVYMAGSRIYHPDTVRYGGWSHCVNIVTIAGVKYLLDGGFGGNGPSRPVPLQHGEVLTQILPNQMRVMHEPITQNLDRSQEVWIFEHRYHENAEWVPMYCFTDMEFIPEDIEYMNFEPWLNPQTFFTHKVVAVRFTTNKEQIGEHGPGSPSEEALEGEIDGSLTINHYTLKWRRHGEKKLEIVFKTEADRLQALEKYFGITFNGEDREAIYGTAAQIGATAMESI